MEKIQKSAMISEHHNHSFTAMGGEYLVVAGGAYA